MSLNSFSSEDKIRAGLVRQPKPVRVPKPYVVEPYTPKVKQWERPDHPCAQFRGFHVEKVYWSIGEIAEMLQIETSAIRYWLDYFGIEIKKDRVGRRQFTKNDVEVVAWIHYLLKVKLYTMEGAKREMQQNG